MTDRPRSFADMLNPEQIRQYMQEAGYVQPHQAQPLPVPMDVPAQPPPQLVEFRGTIEFQAHWELPAVANRSRDELVSDVMAALEGREAPWLPRLRYHVSQLTRIDPGARPLPQAVDARPTWVHPATGATYKINPDGSLQPMSESPPQTTPNGWMASPDRIPPEARREMAVAMSQMQRTERDNDGRIDGLERLAASLASQLDALETQRASRRATRRQSRLHSGDLSADGHDPAPLPDPPVHPAEQPAGRGRGDHRDAPHDRHPGDGDGGGRDAGAQPGGKAAAKPHRDEGRAAGRKRQPARPRLVDVSLTQEDIRDELAVLSQSE